MCNCNMRNGVCPACTTDRVNRTISYEQAGLSFSRGLDAALRDEQEARAQGISLGLYSMAYPVVPLPRDEK